MDEESKQLLREIRDLQRRQMELLERWLPPAMPIRFGLRSLLIALTIVAVFLGVIASINSSRNNASKAAAAAATVKKSL
jgi:hypothetical protein